MTNIVKEGNKYIVEKIKNCTCQEKRDNKYLLTCTIKERGTKCYYYEKNQDYLTYDKKCLHLSTKAKETANKVINDFENEITKYNKRNIDYLRIGNNCYSLMIRKNGTTRIYLPSNYNELANNATYDFDYPEIDKHSLLAVAIQKKDRILELQLKLYYKLATNEEVKELESLWQKKLLPSLPKEYNKSYAVLAKTIDSNLLYNSGYEIFHRPYFSMMNSTHKCYSLNPHDKSGIDAANVNAEIITFDEYLELFK